MNLYSNKYNVLILDNTQIYHNDIFIKYIEAFDKYIKFLLSNFNSIESSFFYYIKNIEILLFI